MGPDHAYHIDSKGKQQCCINGKIYNHDDTDKILNLKAFW